jgi:tetratricopeptide (TPR) repeat protein
MDGFRTKAKACLAQGQTLRAAHFLTKLVELDPSAENLNALADVYLKLGLHNDASALYLRGLQKSARTN